MQTVLFLLGVVTLVVLVEGLINPRMVIRWGEKKTRGKVLMVYGSLFVVLFVAFIAAVPANDTKPTTAVPQTQKTEQKQVEKVSEPAAKLDKKLDFTAARTRVTDWLAEHQFPGYSQITLSPVMFKGEMYKKDGNEYFLFTINGLPRLADILVDPTTGEMFFHDVGVTQPIEKWYMGWRKDHNPDNQQQKQTPANVRIDDKSEWVEMPVVQTINYAPSIVGVVKNISNETYSATINFTTYDANGNQLGTARARIKNVPAGNTWKFVAPIHEKNVARYELSGIRYR